MRSSHGYAKVRALKQHTTDLVIVAAQDTIATDKFTVQEDQDVAGRVAQSPVVDLAAQTT